MRVFLLFYYIKKQNYYKTLEHKTFFFPIRLLWKFHCSIERQKNIHAPNEFEKDLRISIKKQKNKNHNTSYFLPFVLCK
jgi:hypothetical protein